MDTLVYWPPIAIIVSLVGDLQTDLGSVVDLAAVAVLIAGILVVARYRAALSIAQSAADAWHEERDAALSRAERVSHELAQMKELLIDQKAEITALRAKPDLDVLHSVMLEHDKRMTDVQERIVQSLERNSDAILTLVQSVTRPAPGSH